MVEAVGERWWPAYLDCIARNLVPGGKAALQYISIDHRLFDAYAAKRRLHPGLYLSRRHAAQRAAVSRRWPRDRGLSWDDRDGFGGDYAETLCQWRARYDTALRDGRLPGFDERFHALWRYYLMYCEGGFRGGGIDVAQVTLSRS